MIKKNVDIAVIGGGPAGLSAAISAKKLGVKVHEHVFTRHELFISDECFLTGTAAEIVPVVKVDGRVIGEGKPGKITKKIMGEFGKLTKKEGTKYTL